MPFSKAAPWIAAFSCCFTPACLTRKFECPEGEARQGARCLGVDGGDTAEQGTDDDIDSPALQDDAASTAPTSNDDDDAAITLPPTTCYADADGDGYGTNTVADCSAPGVADRTGDCDDNATSIHPDAAELCDGLDNDCDGKSDNGAKNACDGPCSTTLPHAPGDECSNGLLGACTRSGKYVCAGTDSVTCNAPQPMPSPELCDDGIDNDCNGRVDEPTATNAKTWYQDCDADGYASSAQGAVPGCTAPAPLAGCSWTTVFPNQSTFTNWDCDDSNPNYKPRAAAGFPNGGNASWDLDCNGTPAVDLSTKYVDLGRYRPLVNAFTPPACNTFTLSLMNNQKTCATTSTATNFPCVVWLRSTGRYETSPDVFCPDTPLLVDGQGTDTPCQIYTLTPAYKCR